MGVGMMLASLMALGWGVWKFALHGRLFSGRVPSIFNQQLGPRPYQVLVA
jgi:hypothetical protein